MAETAAALTIADLNQYKTQQSHLDSEYPDFIRSFYSPHDDVHGALKAVIGSTKRSLVLEMYGYDDDELADMIAHLLDNPEIHCQITLDKSQAGGVHERALLEKYKAEMESNSVAIGSSEKGAIMHRKMAIVDGLWRISGSTNWSVSGETKQDNELTVIKGAAICAEARAILDLEHTKALTQQAKARTAAAELV